MGGAETSLLSLMASVREARPEWELSLAVGGAGPLEERARALGVSVDVLPFPSALARIGDTGRRRVDVARSMIAAMGSTAFYARRLSLLIGQIQPDVIHINGFKMHMLGSLARPRKTGLIWHMHDYASTRPLMSRLLRLFRGRCDAIIANSHSVADDVKALCPAVPVEPIYNAVDVEQFAPAGELCDLDALCGLPAAEQGTVRVGLMATFARWKGHETFLRALSCLP